MISFSNCRASLTTAGALALAVAMGTPGQASAKDLTIATSPPSLEFPFFVHMQEQLIAEAGAIGVIITAVAFDRYVKTRRVA